MDSPYFENYSFLPKTRQEQSPIEESASSITQRVIWLLSPIWGDFGSSYYALESRQPAAMIVMTVRNNDSIYIGNIHAERTGVFDKCVILPESEQNLLLLGFDVKGKSVLCFATGQRTEVICRRQYLQTFSLFPGQFYRKKGIKSPTHSYT